MLLTGKRGELRSGYTRAVRLGTWSMTRRETLGVCHTTVAMVDFRDEFWHTQCLTSMWLYMGGDSWWVWENVTTVGAIVAGATVEIKCDGDPVVRLNHKDGEAWVGTDSSGRK